MELRIAGAFATDFGRTRGMGGTAREGRERLFWFVLSDRDGCEVFALNGQKNVTAVRKRIGAGEFAQGFVPDPALWAETFMPLLDALLQILEASRGVPDVARLSPAEKGLLLALRTAVAGQEGDRSALLLKLLREAVEKSGEILFRQCSESNARGIRLRKENDPDGALEHYLVAHRASPQDEHLLFNMARAHFEKGETDACRDLLGKSLALRPDFREARAFLRWLDARAVRADHAARPDGSART